MEAKDTVMKDEQMMDLERGISRAEGDHAIADAQAETTWDIAFKAGAKEQERIWSEVFEDGKKAGRREVVEWIPELTEALKDKMWKEDWRLRGKFFENMLDRLVEREVTAQLEKWEVDNG